MLKLENLQFTGSFKDRGALVKLLSLTELERERGVIAMSAGNHAQAVARHAQLLGIPAVIVMPRFTPNIKVEHTRAFGAEVVLHGDALEDAAAFAHAAAEERGLVLVHPYDDERIMAGQGTIALEMLEQQPDLEVLVVPIGGGGLIAGNAIAAKSIRPEIEVIGVETERYPSMQQALRGEPPRCGTGTIAEGIAVKRPGDLTLPVIRDRVDDILLVDEDSIEQAVLLMLEVEKTVSEGAGATPLAALLRYPERFTGRATGLVVSGGNIDLPVLSHIIQRGLARSGRLARLRVAISDISGPFSEVAACIEQAGANIAHVHHHRTFCEQPLHDVEVEFILHTRGTDHLRDILAALTEAGFAARQLL
jgi:threonine dehydratase